MAVSVLLIFLSGVFNKTIIMAYIKLSPYIPNNIKELTLDEPELFQNYYEKGYLIIVKNYKLNADFDFLNSFEVPGPENKRKKYFLTHPKHNHLEQPREKVWRFFYNDVFQKKVLKFRKFKNQVYKVNTQLIKLSGLLFPNYNFIKQPILWKFQKVMGENLHIDNIDKCDEWARLRVFCNIGSSHRIWGISDHIRDVTNYSKQSRTLATQVCSAYDYNQILTRMIYGTSTDSTKNLNAKHFVFFEPGDIWFLNSMVTAHQSLYGNRLVIGSFPHDYSDYINRDNALPNLVKQFREEALIAKDSPSCQK